jgi:hypothetical protein
VTEPEVENARLRRALERIAATAPHHDRKNATWGEHGHHALMVARKIASDALAPSDT